ncbi:MAG: efflux RND transporter periplasmic adaptor subunit [Acidobacteria bacterium]|nr:efflux RND transporter periplasmic adaptor subunit [Acidobacteriota bacterium]
MAIRPALPRQVWVVLFALGLGGALAWVATQSGPLAPVRVTLTEATTGSVAPALSGIGTVEARRTYFIGPTSAGRVRRVLVDVGDTVAAGQLLAEMEPVDLDTRMASTLAAADRGRSQIAAAEAQVRDATSRRDLAVTEARRAVDLGAAGVVSQSVVDGARQEQRSAEAALAAAEAALAGARRDLARLDAELGGARQQRANIRLFAPVDGLVISRDAEPGSTVIAGQAVLKVHDPASLWVNVRFDQGRSAGLAVGLPAEIVRRADPLRQLRGRVTRVEPVSDSVTEERMAKVAFDERPPDLSTGELAEVTLHLPEIARAVVVPNASLRQRGTDIGVWRLVDGRLRFAPVTIGAEGLDGTVQVLEGLTPGDQLVLHSERDLADDARITVVPALAGGGR